MANKSNSLAHTKWMCKYHIVFIPKYRRKAIYGVYKESIRDILKQLCRYKGVEILEAHDEEEIQTAIAAGARMIGVNNRDLKTFTVDIGNSERLKKLVPDNILFIAESGIKTSADIRKLQDANVNGVLIGETFMRAENKKEMLNELRLQK